MTHKVPQATRGRSSIALANGERAFQPVGRSPRRGAASSDREALFGVRYGPLRKQLASEPFALKNAWCEFRHLD